MNHWVYFTSLLDLDSTSNLLATFWIKTGQSWESCTTNRAAITLDLWYSTIAISNQCFQFEVTDFLWHFAHQIVVV